MRHDDRITVQRFRHYYWKNINRLGTNDDLLDWLSYKLLELDQVLEAELDQTTPTPISGAVADDVDDDHGIDESAELDALKP